MRRLLLLRHAKSARPEGVRDFDRPLSKRGREAAPRIGAYLADEQLVPDLALVSPARRARETWDLVKRRLGGVSERFEPRIYEATTEELLAIVRGTASEIGALLMVGHNPGFEELAKRLAGSGERDAQKRLAQKYPTAALAVIDLTIEDWGDAAPCSGHLQRFVIPRALGVQED
jgi:phosphohistidine phosphatase